MNLGRILANAFARRIAYVVVGLVLAWLGLGRAYAAPPQTYADQPAAYSACMSYAQQAQAVTYSSWPANTAYFDARCPLSGTTYSCFVTLRWAGNVSGIYGCNNVVPAAPEAFMFPAGSTCSARPSSTFSSELVIPTGSHGCSGGCQFVVANNGDGTYQRIYSASNNATCNVLPECNLAAGEYLNHATSLCQKPPGECKANQTKNPKTGACEEACPTGMVMDATGSCKPAAEECPPGNIKAPSGQCLPGEGQCAAGEARRPNGTCGVDSDGDGEADEDDDDPNNDPDQETASGGDSCNAPPSCSGGPIDCLQVKIQWRIDCNTRRNENVSGGACAAMPVCTGEKCRALEYSQLLMQWRTACALEKLKLPGAGEGGDGETIKPDFEALAGASDGANPDDSIFLPDGDGESFNQSLVSYGAGALGWNFGVDGQQFAMPQEISDFIAVLKWLIIAAASLVGIAIAWDKL